MYGSLYCKLGASSANHWATTLFRGEPCAHTGGSAGMRPASAERVTVHAPAVTLA